MLYSPIDSTQAPWNQCSLDESDVSHPFRSITEMVIHSLNIMLAYTNGIYNLGFTVMAVKVSKLYGILLVSNSFLNHSMNYCYSIHENEKIIIEPKTIMSAEYLHKKK